VFFVEERVNTNNTRYDHSILLIYKFFISYENTLIPI